MSILQRFSRLYKDIQNLVYIEIYKLRVQDIKYEMGMLMWYMPHAGLLDDRGKRFNWRDLSNDNPKPFYNGPIYREICHIGKFSETTESECPKIYKLPERYIYSLHPEYDL